MLLLHAHAQYSQWIESTALTGYDYVMGEYPMNHPAGKFYFDAINT